MASSNRTYEVRLDSAFPLLGIFADSKSRPEMETNPREAVFLAADLLQEACQVLDRDVEGVVTDVVAVNLPFGMSVLMVFVSNERSSAILLVDTASFEPRPLLQEGKHVLAKTTNTPHGPQACLEIRRGVSHRCLGKYGSILLIG